jgi:hypothetical protein
MTKTFGAALLLASAFALATVPAFALEVDVKQMTKNPDGTMTYHFSVKTDKGETLAPGSDFVTVYNFAGLVDGSVKTPAGWQFTSADYGKTPTWNGYPVVMPVDMPGLSNLTWSPSKAVAGGVEVDGFSATTHIGATSDGEYAGQATRSTGGKSSEQAVIGHIQTPNFLP